MANDEQTRSQYLQALLNQRKQLNGNGSVLVNPSISNDVEQQAQFKTNVYQSRQMPVNQQDLDNITKSEEEKESSVLGKIFGFVDEIAAKFSAGFVGAFEGILDLGATALGAITGDEKFNQWAEQDIASNFAEWSKTYANFTPWGIISNISNGNYGNSQYWEDMWNGAKDIGGTALFIDNELGNYRQLASDKYYTMDDDLNTGFGEFLGGAAYSIGFMLPSIMTGNATYASTGSQVASKVASLASMGLSATGKGSEEALQEGATAGQALGYGAASGAVEVASEIVVGKALRKLAEAVGISSKGFGKVKAVSFAKETISKVSAKELAKTMFEEGVEEVFSDILAPVCQTIYKGTDALKQYGEADYYKNMALSFASGAFVGGLTGAVDTATKYAKFGKEGVAFIENNNKYKELIKEYEALERAGKDTTEIEGKIKTSVQSMVDSLSNMKGDTKHLNNLLEAYQQGSADQFTQELNKDTKQVIADKISEQVRNSTGKQNFSILLVNADTLAKSDTKAFYDPNTETVVVNKNYADQFTRLINHEVVSHVLLDSNDSSYKSLIDVINNNSELKQEFHKDDEALKRSYGNNEAKLESERLARFIESKLTNVDDFNKIFTKTALSKSKMINLLRKVSTAFNGIKGIDSSIVKNAQKAIQEMQNTKPEQANAKVELAYSKKIVEGKETVNQSKAKNKINYVEFNQHNIKIGNKKISSHIEGWSNMESLSPFEQSFVIESFINNLDSLDAQTINNVGDQIYLIIEANISDYYIRENTSLDSKKYAETLKILENKENLKSLRNYLKENKSQKNRSFYRRIDELEYLFNNYADFVGDVDNLNPTSNEDIRFAKDIDASGNELSNEQVEFFKDSKIRDDKGNLILASHFTGKNFTKFSKEKYGTGAGQVHGNGFYFFSTNDFNKLVRSQLLGFVNTNKEMDGYLNIKNPLISNKKMSFDEYKKFARESVEWFNEDTFYTSNIWNTFEKIYNECSNNDQLLISIKENFKYSKKKIDTSAGLSSIGYDGIIIDRSKAKKIDLAEYIRIGQKLIENDGIVDPSLAQKYYDMQSNFSNEYIAFNSNQFKDIENKIPTYDEDIRFAKDYARGNYIIGDNNIKVNVKKVSKGYDVYENGKVVHEAFTQDEVRKYLDDNNAKRVDSEGKVVKSKYTPEQIAEKKALGKYTMNDGKDVIKVSKYEGVYQVLRENGSLITELKTIDEVNKYIEENKAVKYKYENSTKLREKNRLKVGSKYNIYSRDSNGDILIKRIYKNEVGNYIVETKNESSGDITDTNFGNKYKEAVNFVKTVGATNNRADLFKKVENQVSTNKTDKKSKTKSKEKAKVEVQETEKAYFKTIKTTEDIVKEIKFYIENNSNNNTQLSFPKSFDNFSSRAFTEINGVKNVDLEVRKLSDLLMESTVRDYDENEMKWIETGKLGDILSTNEKLELEKKIKNTIELAEDKEAKSNETRPFEMTLNRVVDKLSKTVNKTHATRVLTNQRRIVKLIIRNVTAINDTNVQRNGFDFLLYPIYELEGKNGYSSKGLKARLNEVLKMYESIGKQPDIYNGLPYYSQISDMISTIIDSIGEPVTLKNGKVQYSEITAQTTQLLNEYIRAVRFIINQTRTQARENFIPSAMQTIGAINAMSYGNRTDFVSKLFRSYKRGFAPAYVVLRQMLGGNSKAAQVLTVDYQNAQNSKQIYVGSYSDLINDKLKELGIKKQLGKRVFMVGDAKLSADQAMFLYISLNVEANKQAINETGVKYIDENGRTKKLVGKNSASFLETEINKILPDKYKKLATWILDTMNDSVKSEYIKWYETKMGKWNGRNEIGDIKENSYWILSRAYQQMPSVEKAVTNPMGVFSRAKSRKENVNNEVLIGGALSGFQAYIDQLGTELYLKPTYREALSILNTKVNDNESVYSLMTNKLDPQDISYLKNTMDDMVGALNNTNDLFTGIMSRFSVAKLSLNIGTMLKQFASIWTSNLPISKSTKALYMRMFDNADIKAEYNEIIDEIGGLKYRESNAGVVKANADNLSQLSEKIAEKGMIGISKVDLFTINTGIYSLMVIGQDQYKYKIGTKANKDFVKEQWHEFELSQIGNGSLSKNAVGRGDYGALAKGLFSFLQGANRAALGSQINKLDLFLRNRNLKASEVKLNLKNARTALTKFQNANLNEDGIFNSADLNEEQTQKYIELKTAEIDAKMKFDDYRKYQIAGSKNIPINMAAGLIAQGIFVALINELMRHIKGKKDWDDWSIAELGTNTALSIGVDWIPLVNTISSMIQGYEVQVPAVEVFNQITELFKSFPTDGDWQGFIKNLAILIGDTTGIPFQTIYQYIYGAVKTFNPATAFEMNSVLYGSSVATATKTLNTYVEKGNTTKANQMLDVVLDNYRVESSDLVKNEITNLLMSGYDTLPKQFMTEFTNENNETVQLSSNEIASFRELYNQSDKDASKLIGLTEYKTLTQEQQAKILKKLYNAYYSFAKSKVAGTTPSTKLEKLLVLTNGNIDLANYLIYLEKLSTITANKTKTKKELSIEYINRLKINRNEKLLLMYLNGYKLADDSKNQLISYLVKNGASKKEAQELLGD